jgi:iron complex outermembrane receptor protein
MHTRLFIWIFLAGAFAGHLDGQDTLLLPDVTIEVLPFGEKYLEATGGINLLKREEIDGFHELSSAGLFQLVPGAQMASGALNTHRLVIRGVGSRTPYGTNRIRAYLDDIPLTSGDGISTLEDQDPRAIGNMEVLKGPASALYGSGLGGIVRLNSPYPVKPGYRLSAGAEGGSFQSRRYTATGSYKQGTLALSGGYARTTTEGFRENSRYLRNNAFLHARLFLKKHELSLTLSLVDLYAAIPSSLSEEDFVNNPENAGGSWGDIQGYESYWKILAGMKVKSTLGPRLSNHFMLYTSTADPYERRPFNILDEKSSNLGFREYMELGMKEWKLRAGLEFFSERFAWSTYQTLPESQGPLLSDQRENRRYLNSFFLVQWQPTASLLLDAGGNINLLSYGLETLYRLDSADQSGTYRYDPVFSPRIGISLHHGKRIWSYFSAGHGFSAPSLEETLLPEGTLNTSLKPETGWAMELGNRGELFAQSLQYDVTLYTIYLKNMLVTERLAEDIFTGVNAGTALNTGIEFLIGKDLYPGRAEDLHIRAVLSGQVSRNTFLEFVDDGADYSGNSLPGIPMQEFHATLEGEKHGWSMRIRYVFTGAQWMDDANDRRYPGYHLFNLDVDKKFCVPGFPLCVHLYGGIRNLLNTRYASMILINAPSFGGSDPRYYYPGSPRYFFLGVLMSFNRPSPVS